MQYIELVRIVADACRRWSRLTSLERRALLRAHYGEQPIPKDAELRDLLEQEHQVLASYSAACDDIERGITDATDDPPRVLKYLAKIRDIRRFFADVVALREWEISQALLAQSIERYNKKHKTKKRGE
jgi:hypothetical protein